MSWTIEKATRNVGRTLYVEVESGAWGSFLPWRWQIRVIGSPTIEAYGFSRSLQTAQKAALKAAADVLEQHKKAARELDAVEAELAAPRGSR